MNQDHPLPPAGAGRADPGGRPRLEFRFLDGEPPVPGPPAVDRTVPSRFEEKAALLRELMGVLEAARCVEPEHLLHVRLCLDEAIVNAMEHGNRRDPRLRVRVRLFLSDDRWGVLVEDEGGGFSPADVPDPGDPAALLRERGRGILIMTGFMDEVSYFGGGSRLWMTRGKRG
jgi:serine/threonine-protein kinase RsbW